MNDTALGQITRSIDIDQVFPHTREVIWKTLTNGALMARWMMAPTGFTPALGARFTFSTTGAGAWDGTIHCQIVELIPHERLAYSWCGGDAANVGYGSLLDTLVTWTLTPVETGTRLRIVHSGFVLPRNDSTYANLGAGWQHVLPALRAVIDEEN